ncbi:MAG: helix-turn-helix domain-containing protein [Bdellovibrionales bacterium]|nr:helix-turn-helix domain-containing protein [Bdellovibrionales bacterium]
MNHRLADQTYYEILEVASDATQQQIHAAYHRARNTYSPESPALYSMFTREEARDLMTLIEEAFSTLSNQAKRKDYDRQLIRQTTQKDQTQFGPANASEELPDFQVPEQGPKVGSAPLASVGIANTADIEQIAVNQKSFQPSKPKADRVPEGFGKTRFSAYQIDPNFENEINQTRTFDGTFLQKVRIYKQVNLDQLSQETRISRTYLSALESNNFKSLPAPVFTRGFVVQVAKILGLNEKLVADSYMSLYRNEKF